MVRKILYLAVAVTKIYIYYAHLIDHGMGQAAMAITGRRRYYALSEWSICVLFENLSN